MRRNCPALAGRARQYAVTSPGSGAMPGSGTITAITATTSTTSSP
ncbi:MAG: hypothetical protein ABR926_04620 [Streptosporangiaceae bacterium]